MAYLEDGIVYYTPIMADDTFTTDPLERTEHDETFGLEMVGNGDPRTLDQYHADVVKALEED